MADFHPVIDEVHGFMLLTDEELARGKERPLNLGIRPRAPAEPTAADGSHGKGSDTHSPALLTAEGMEAETGVAASWFESAASRGAIPSVRFGRWVRFDLREVLASGIPEGARRVIGGDNHREQLELPLKKAKKK